MNRILSLSQQSLGTRPNLGLIRFAFRFIAIGLGVLHTYAAIRSQSMSADGIAYLDIGDAYFRGDWEIAISAVWSPLYSWILGFVNFLVKPSMQWEFPVVHFVGFFIYLLCLASFEFMWRNVRRPSSQEEGLHLSTTCWWSLGYLLFIWTSLSLIQIWTVNPDMLMAVFVLLAAGQIARIRAGDQDWRTFLSLGLFLGFGYLSKAFMFYISLVLLGLAWFVQRRSRASTYRILVSAGIFLLVSMPFILLISWKQGTFTISEAGTVTYVRHVIGIPYPHWQGDPLRDIMPDHPSRLIHRSPNVYEFGEPIGGTYPISTDPAYWYEGIKAPIELRHVFTPLFLSALFYADLFLRQQGVFLAAVTAMYFMMQWRNTRISELMYHWVLVVPAVAAFGLYGLVLVANRYIGVFVLLFWADVLANIQLSADPNNKSWLKVLSSIAAIGLLLNIILFNLDGFKRLTPSLEGGLAEPTAPPAQPLAVAETLRKLGISQGDKVGVIGYAYDSFWARLARVKIVAELLEEDANDLWWGDEDLQQSVLKAFKSTGASAVIAEYVPAYAHLDGWHRVENSNYYIYIFEGHRSAAWDAGISK